MNEAERLKNEGNEFFAKQDYLNALEKYNAATQVEPRLAAAWFNKGQAHKKLAEYAEALNAFERALALDPNYQKAKDKQADVLKIIMNTEQPQDAYSETIFRPIICNDKYLAELNSLSIDIYKKLTFPEQVKAILDLFQFIEKYYNRDSQLYAFIKSELCTQTEMGKKLRLHEIGNKIVYLNQIPPNFADFMDEASFKIIAVVQEDIFFEDIKKVLRMIFEIIYHFPREKRGELLAQLPWAENSWYLFEFCGAVFIDDSAIDREAQQGGISIIPYSFNKDVNKQRQLRFYLQALMHHTAIVKIAILDILKKDMPVFREYFANLLAALDAETTTKPATKPATKPKMGELPYLRALLWYSKQTFNTQRLLAVLPAVPGNNPQDIDVKVLENAGITANLNDEQEINLLEFLAKQKIKADVPAELKTILPSLLKLLSSIEPASNMRELIKYGLIEQPSLIKYGMESPPKGKKFSTMDFAAGPLTPLKRLQLASSTSYLNIATLKGRLAFIRKLQLVGEVFIPRNWGNHLKYIDFIRAEMLATIRNGLTHIEDHDYFSVVELLELDEAQIKKLFRELQTLKEQVYEETVKRQAQFPVWPDDQQLTIGMAFPEWVNFASDYWEAVKNFYEIRQPFDDVPYIPSQPLLSDGEIRQALNAINVNHLGIILRMLQGKEPYVIERLDDYLKKDLDKKDKKAICRIFSNAEKKYKELRKTAKDNEVANGRRQKQELADNIKSNMTRHYPTIEALGKNFWGAEQRPHADTVILFERLKNRITTLYELIRESEITITNRKALQTELKKLLEQDVAFLLSTTYLVGQILGLLNKLATLINLESIDSSLEQKLGSYISLRNVIEHTDPILESMDLPYYQMLSTLPRMMAVVVSELSYDYREKILQVDVANSPELINAESKARLKQERAIDPSSYNYVDNNPISNKQSRKVSNVASSYKEFYLRLENYERSSSRLKADDTLEQQLIRQAQRFGFSCINVAKDGNCFFHAISYQLHIPYEQLLAATVDHIINNLDLYKHSIDEDIDKFIDKFSAGGEWADQVVIQAASRVLKINIAIIRSDGQDPFIIKQAEPFATVYLGYEVGLHYQALQVANPANANINIQQYIDGTANDLVSQFNLSETVGEIRAIVNENLSQIRSNIQQAQNTGQASYSIQDLPVMFNRSIQDQATAEVDRENGLANISIQPRQ